MCKSYSVNVTICLNSLSALALKMIYLKHNIDRPISYDITISPRAIINDPKFTNEYDYNNMGYFLIDNYDLVNFDSALMSNCNNLNEHFWKICQEKTNQLNLSIKNVSFKTVAYQVDFNPYDTNVYIDLMISNLNRFKQTKSKYECQEILKTIIVCDTDANYYFAFNFFHSINEQNGFTSIFNSNFVSEDIIHEYIQNFYSFLDKIVN